MQWDTDSKEDSPIGPQLVRNPFAKVSCETDKCKADSYTEDITEMGSWHETDSDEKIDANSTTDDENCTKCNRNEAEKTNMPKDGYGIPIKVSNTNLQTPVSHQPPLHQHLIIQ